MISAAEFARELKHVLTLRAERTLDEAKSAYAPELFMIAADSCLQSIGELCDLASKHGIELDAPGEPTKEAK